MELNAQIKKYRTELNLSQEELAEKVYVTRQTISNWENGKSYPDIHSLLLLSSLFNVSLDQLIKGDVETMKEIINEQEVKKLNHYSTIYAVHFIVLLLSAVPLFMWLEWYALIPFGISVSCSTWSNSHLDELHKAVEAGKRPYQNILKVFAGAGVAALVCILIGFFMHIFLN